MALTQTRLQIRTNVRRFTNTGGTNSLARHPDTDLNEYIDRALASLQRLLNEFIADQRFLSSGTIALSTLGGTTYPLPGTFDHLISVDLTANGHKSWLVAYEMHERAMLTSPDLDATGIPITYRLRGANIEYLPAPSGSYTSTLWFVPAPTQFTADGDTVDTINRLDDYLIAYASQFVAIKNKDTELLNICNGMMGDLRSDIATVARTRDKNSPPRIVDDSMANRWGRKPRLRMR